MFYFCFQGSRVLPFGHFQVSHIFCRLAACRYSKFLMRPGWGPRPKPDMSRPKLTHEGGVVRSKLHGLETRMNARWSGHERTMVWTWTHDGLVTARWSGHERTKVWTWTHEKFSCVHFQTFVRSCPDHRAFISRTTCVQVQTIVRSCPDFRVFTRRKKITCWGAVQILETEDRKGSKTPQIQIFKVFF